MKDKPSLPGTLCVDETRGPSPGQGGVHEAAGSENPTSAGKLKSYERRELKATRAEEPKPYERALDDVACADADSLRDGAKPYEFRELKPYEHRERAPDGVVCAEADPLRDGPVLLGLLRQLVLDEEGLLGRLRAHGAPEGEHTARRCTAEGGR